MRNFLHIAFLLAAMLTWLLGIFLGFHQPLFGIVGTCCTLGFLVLALKAAEKVRS